MKWIPRLAWASIPMVLILYGIKVWTKAGYTDFEVYYRAAEQFASGQFSAIYNAASGASPFRYAPWNLPLFAPLAIMPFAWARLAWFVLNALGFASGFYLLTPAVRAMVPAARVPTVLSLGYLGTLRFMLDCFTIGQVTGLMFAGWAWATTAYALKRTPGEIGVGIFLPASLKLGGAIQMLFPLADYWSERTERKKILPLLTGLLLPAFGLGLGTFGWIIFRAPSGAEAGALLLAQYREVSAATFSASAAQGSSAAIAALNAHYGSQSLLSALLRLAAQGWWSAAAAQIIWVTTGVIATLGLAALSVLRRPQTVRARFERFALGTVLYLLWMPFQFKYGYPLLAIPVLALLAAPWPLGQWPRAALIFGALALSLAGLDIYGEALFFGLQRASVPVLATLFLGSALLWQHITTLGAASPRAKLLTP